jgi:DHA1 family tetracycline resistance protein-like MFS transporter
MLIGPGMFSLTFAFFIAPEHRLPGAPWYLAALLLAVSLLIAWSVTGNKAAAASDLTAAAAEAEAN